MNIRYRHRFIPYLAEKYTFVMLILGLMYYLIHIPFFNVQIYETASQMPVSLYLGVQFCSYKRNATALSDSLKGFVSNYGTYDGHYSN